MVRDSHSIKFCLWYNDCVMVMTQEQLYEALVEGGGIKKEQFLLAKNSREAKTFGIDAAVVSSGFLSEKQVGQLIADWYGVKYLDIQTIDILPATLQKIPAEFAKKSHVLPVKETDEKMLIVSSVPSDIELQSLLEKYVRKEIEFAYATPREIEAQFSLYDQDVRLVFEKLLKASSVDSGDTTIRLVDTIFGYAMNAHASDIHIEPEGNYTVIRFRIDGLLQDIADLPKALHDGIITRLKVLARLATDEHRAAQDGRIGYTDKKGEKIDVRLSIVPTTTGEKAVMRLLSTKMQSFSLKDLGMNERDNKLFREIIKKPWGMILVTGPTGSGKTTTLYAALKKLNKREVNIATIEDPVEYEVDGVSQIQVNTKTNLTFAKGLRSIVRQDPDIIMVGEIRDSETADIAVNAAMTGHLVLSTLHTNDAATTFPRLKDMEVENFLVSSTALGVIAQRLVRKICLKCIHSMEITEKELAIVKANPLVEKYLKEITGTKTLKKTRLFKGKGCTVCKHTGYSGRTGVFELLEVSDAVRVAIMENENAEMIKDIAVKEGMQTMLRDGLEKVIMGITTLEEVLRVTQE